MAGAMMAGGAKEQALRKLLEDTMILLDSVGETFWSSRIRTALGSNDPTHVLSLFGGMGSFNDLMIAAVNGHQIRGEQEPAVNARLEELRRQIHELATQLKA
jgi:hypothetical protein